MLEEDSDTRAAADVSKDDGESQCWVRGPQGRTSQGTSPLGSVKVSIAECAFRLCEEGRRGVRMGCGYLAKSNSTTAISRREGRGLQRCSKDVVCGYMDQEQ